MCGNGSRCAAVFAKLVGAAGDEQHVETLAGSLHAVIAPNGRFARVRLSLPSEMKHYPQLDLGGEKDDVWLLDTGVPHAVRFVGDVAAVDIVQAGPILRRHPALGPRGANADFVQLLPGNDIRIRTFERGVEGETLACGTGAAACAIVSALAHGRRSPVRVQVASGDVLTIHFTLIDKTHAAEPYLEGAVKTVYAGEFFWE
jgi:diaminopimelate epimerase